MGGGGAKEEEQDGMSVHSPCKAPPSSASSLSKVVVVVGIDNGDVVDMDCFGGAMVSLAGAVVDGWREWTSGVVIAPHRHSTPKKKLFSLHFTETNEVMSHAVDTSLIFLGYGIHRHFVLYGVMEFLRRSFDRQFSSEEVMRLLDRFYNLKMLRGDDEDAEFPHREEEFTLPQSYFAKDES
uniref:Uncharacterized protein n=1 Tax=Chenopodium quinoa TaxID=63459 RepID=A0A803L7T8_CHEQI